MDPTFPLASIANFLACVLVLLPLFSTSIRSGSWNVAVISTSLWIAVLCAIAGVNAILWSDNVRNVAPVWCDITTHLEGGARIALRACTFVMTRSLYHISRGVKDALSKRSNARMISDLAWTLGLPVLTMFFYYVVQEHRFQIIEEQGCVSSVYGSGLSILLLEMPSLILPAISALFYCPHIVWLTYKRRKDIKKYLTEGSGTSTGIYFRVMALGCVEAVFTLPFSIFTFISDIQPLPDTFYPGWRIVHANFSTIPTIPASEWKESLWPTIDVKCNLWINPVVACAFFALFGLTKEVRAAYYNYFCSVRRMVGLKESPPPDMSCSVCSEMRFGIVSVRGVSLNNPTDVHVCLRTDSRSSQSEIESIKTHSMSPNMS